MSNATVSLTETIREMAERRVLVRDGCETDYPTPSTQRIRSIGHDELDPRFLAFRGEHEYEGEFSYANCQKCGTALEIPDPYCLNTSLDAILETFAVVVEREFSGVGFNFCKRDWGYDVQFVTDGKEWGWQHGETKTLAAALALQAAVT